MAFGFLLCPYLDPTFHVALQRSPSRHCFAVFGAAFTVMLLFTAAFSDAGLGPTPAPGALLWGKPVFEWQWGLQAAFTMVAVAAALRSLEPVSRLGGTTAVLPGLIVMACLALGWQYLSESALPPMAAALRPASGPVLGEATYLRWLGLYGVLFPAMVLLGLRRTPVAVIVISIAGAGLLAEWGMIGGRFPMLTAAVGLLLAASMWSERPIDDSGEMTHVKPR
jgi:hypothetical protein